MKPRVLVLPLAALIIAALVAWRYQRDVDRPSPLATEDVRQLAPRFELYDQHSRLVKFERYLGRTELLVVFVDGKQPADENSLLVLLRDEAAALTESGLQMVAISLATPYAVREAERRSGIDFPFPVLTDIDPRVPIPAPVHRMWGLAGDGTDEFRTGAFYVDRRGLVASQNGLPWPLEDPAAFISARLH